VVARSFALSARGQTGPVEWRLGGFRTTNDDDIQFVASATRGRAFFRNIGRTRRQGLEATVAYRSGGLSVRGGYAFTDATFRTPLLLNAPDNPSADAQGRISVLPGDRLPGIPRHRALLTLDYEARRWSAGADVQAASGQVLFGDEANLRPGTDGYAIVGLRGSVRLFGPVHLFGEVRNLFDARYATFGAFGATDEVELEEAPGASDPRSFGPGAPRRWLVGIRSEF
jgi:iron complex outermembrane recepter protein